VSHHPILFSTLCCLVAAGCSEDDDDWIPPSSPRPSAVGNVEFSWTIDGRSDAAACELVAATAFEVVIFDEGFFVTEVEAPCDVFQTNLELYVDDYVARTTLVDGFNDLATGRLVTDFFVIREGEVTRLSVDFPSGSAVATPDAGNIAPAPDAGVIPPVPDAGVVAPTDADAAAP